MPIPYLRLPQKGPVLGDVTCDDLKLCAHCGEDLGAGPLAELVLRDSECPEYGTHALVHAEPCQPDALATGRWEAA